MTTENGKPDDPSNQIYIEPEVYSALIKYVTRVSAFKLSPDTCREITDANGFQKRMRVKYLPRHAYGNPIHEDCEDGIVSSTNDKHVFVKFRKHLEKFGWDGTKAQSCSPNDLLFLGDYASV